MNRYNQVCCKTCGEPIFFIPENYSMGVDIVCISCGTKKTKKKKSPTRSKTRVTAAANYARVKGGIRKDIHPSYYFRSATEANFARLLNHFGITWKFEERSFTFDGYKNKPYVYIMDFEIIKVDRRKKPPEGFEAGWVEVKGYMNSNSRSKLRRLKIKYPDEAAKTTVIIYSKYKKKDIEFCEKLGYKYLFYDVLCSEYSEQIPDWE